MGLILPTLSAHADTVVLKSGKKITGRVVSQDDEYVRVVKEGGKKVRVKNESIAEILLDEKAERATQPPGARRSVAAPSGFALSAMLNPAAMALGIVTGGVVFQGDLVPRLGSFHALNILPTFAFISSGPVAGASILTIPGDFKAVTDGSGNFKIEKVPAGSYLVVVSAKGFMSRSKVVSIPDSPSPLTGEGHGGGAVVSVTIVLTPISAVSTGKPNNPPSIDLTSPPTAIPGSSVELIAEVSDADEDAVLFLQWKANGGSFDKTWSETVNWTAPTANGIYIISVRVTDGLATDTASTIIMVTTGETLSIDTVPPDTDFTNTPCPKGDTSCFIKSASASFEFASNEPKASFLCQLDQSPKEPCTSPKTYDNLSNAKHTLQVHAIDAAGNPDFSPVLFAWTTDAAAPVGSNFAITRGSTATHVSASFDLAADFLDDGSGVKNCQYCKTTDGKCDTEWNPGNFADGKCTILGVSCTDGENLTLGMRATDVAGNIGETPTLARKCDVSGPSTGTVKDGTGADAAYQTTASTMSANWTGFEDANGIA